MVQHPKPTLTWNPSTVQILRKALHTYGWQVTPSEVSSQEGSWRLSERTPQLEKVLHQIRDSWRMVEATRWLASGRRDTAIARQEAFAPSPTILNSEKALVAKSDGHTAALVSGGMMTAAITFNRNNPILQYFADMS